MSTKVWGVKIILSDKASPLTEDTDIGLYNVAGSNSEFRWIQNAISGVTDWKDGILVKGGIKKYSRSVDLTFGGAIAQAGTCEVVISNTGKFQEELNTLGITLEGCRIEIWKFTDSTPAQKWVGKISTPRWTTTQYVIPSKGFYGQRSTLIRQQTVLTGDKVVKIPLTFGQHEKAKAICIANSETRFVVAESQFISTNVYLTATERNVGIDTFPIMASDGGSPADQYTILLGSLDYPLKWVSSTGEEHGALLGGTLSYFTGKYIKVISGDQSGKYRKIASASVHYLTGDSGEYKRQLRINLEDGNPFEANLATDLSVWIQIVDADKQYQFDEWPCVGPTDENGVEVTNGHTIFTHDEKQTVSGTSVLTEGAEYRKAAEGLFAVEMNSDKNTAELSPRIFEGTPDTIASYVILPMAKVLRATDKNVWGLGSYQKVMGSLYARGNCVSEFILFDTAENLQSKTTDKDSSTYSMDGIRIISAGSDARAAYGLVLEPPALPDDLDFDSVYLGVRLFYDASNSDLRFYWRRFAGDPIIFKSLDAGENGDQFDVNNFPGSYYVTPSEDNDTFFFNRDGLIGDNFYGRGYTTFQIDGVTSRDLYKQIYQMAIWLFYANGDIEGTHYQLNYEFAMIFKKSMKIDKEIYMPFKGRILGGPSSSGWGGRKTWSDLLEYPHEILESACRLQQDENSITPTLGWGKNYSDGIGINIAATVGGFDDTSGEYDVIKSMRCVAQFEGEITTDELKKSICREFQLVNWVNAAGEECVIRIVKPSDTAAVSVSVGNIFDRGSIKIEEQDPARIYSEPFVQYDKDPATGDYKKRIAFKNSSAGAYTLGFVEGWEGTEAEEYWTRCQTLFGKVRRVNKPPSDLTDLDWANGDDADEIAKNYVRSWIDWQFAKMAFLRVHEELAGDWEECERFTLNLPHHTNGANAQCIVAENIVEPNPPYLCDVKAYLFDSGDAPEDFTIQDTSTVLTGSDQWQDTSNSGEENIQDV